MFFSYAIGWLDKYVRLIFNTLKETNHQKQHRLRPFSHQSIKGQENKRRSTAACLPDLFPECPRSILFCSVPLVFVLRSHFRIPLMFFYPSFAYLVTEGKIYLIKHIRENRDTVPITDQQNNKS